MRFQALIARSDALRDSQIHILNQGVQFVFDPKNSENIMAFISSMLLEDSFDLIFETHSIIVSHRSLLSFLEVLGIEDSATNAIIEEFYTENRENRLQLLSHEISLNPSEEYLTDENLLKLEAFGWGPRPMQSLLNFKIQIPQANEAFLSAYPSPVVVFFLDRSESMSHSSEGMGGASRFTLLKETVLKAVAELPSNAVVSIYFHNTRTNAIIENTVKAEIPALWLQEEIANINPLGTTNITASIKEITPKLFERHGSALENLSFVWLTDGYDGQIQIADELARFFDMNHWEQYPKIIPIGIGKCSEALLNGIAEDARFRSSKFYRLHNQLSIDNIVNQLIENIGKINLSIQIILKTTDQIICEDLGRFQEKERKNFIIETHSKFEQEEVLDCYLKIDNLLFKQKLIIHPPLSQNLDLQIAYFQQKKAQIIELKKTHPQDATRLRDQILSWIPSSTPNKRLLGIQHDLVFLDRTLPLSVEDTETLHQAFPIRKHPGFFDENTASNPHAKRRRFIPNPAEEPVPSMSSSSSCP